MLELGPVLMSHTCKDSLCTCCSAHIKLKGQGITVCVGQTVRYTTPQECRKTDAELQALLDTSRLPLIVQCYEVFTATTPGERHLAAYGDKVSLSVPSSTVLCKSYQVSALLVPTSHGSSGVVVSNVVLQ